MWPSLINEFKQFKTFSLEQRLFFFYVFCFIFILGILMPLGYLQLQNYQNQQENLQALKIKTQKIQTSIESDRPDLKIPDKSNSLLNLQKTAEDQDLLLSESEQLPENYLACTLEGSYLDFLEFLKKYAANPWPADLQKINITKKDKKVSIELLFKFWAETPTSNRS